MSIYLSIFKQCIIDPIQNSIVVPIFNHFTAHSIQTLLLLPIILPIFNHFTTNPIKTLLLLPIFLPILNLLIIHPLQNNIILPILNRFTTGRIQNHIILSILDLLPTHPIKKFLLLPIIGFIGKQIKDHLLKFVFNHLLKCIFVPIKPHIFYPFKCNSYVEKLKTQTEKLKEKRNSLEISVFETDEVTKWLSSANNEINEADALIQRKEEAKMKKCFFGLCPNLKSSYQLSKEADKRASAIDKLRNQEGLVPFSSRPPLQQIVEPSVYSREALPSRVLILNKVMDALRDSNLYMIGVYGLGGVGKTTLAKEVQRKAMEEKMFKRVVMVPVSRTPDLRQIQEQIADFVDLKFDAQGVAGRASQLKKWLEKSKLLIILDDIWTEFELNAVGIPLEDECKGSKLLLTSRSHDVLSHEMGTQKEFPLEVLREEETWKLFQKTLKDANNPELQAIAIKVSKKCSGLPLLVNIVAADLKNKELRAWRDALVKLSDLDNEEIHGKVHKVLKSSYENLRSNDAKSLFLLCSLFGPSNIPINHLLTYAMGLGLFKNIVGVKVARDRLCVTIEKLKTESLLLDGDMNGYMKMHDVVLDFARSIAIKDEHAFFGINGNGLRQLWPADENCTRIVLHHCNISELPEGLEYPNGELLSLFTKDLNLVIPDLFFNGIRKLKVLNLTGMCLMPMPSSVQFLINLHSLYLHRCQLDDVAIVGDLKQLEFLSFEGSCIVELPSQIGKLTQLKSLNLAECSYLKVIPPNVLPKLSLLEELYIKSFDEWDLKGNASLMELEELRQLTTLEVRASCAKELPNQLFSKELEMYKISIGKWDDYWWTYEGSRSLKLRLKTSIHLEDGLKELLRGSEDLFLGEVKGMENGLYDLNEEGFPKLKYLDIKENKAIRHIDDSTMWVSCDAFPVLEGLVLTSLYSLEEFCHGQLKAGSFSMLRTLIIIGCGKLKKLFSFSIAKNLSQLQKMEVSWCNNLEAVIAEGSEDGICNPRKVFSETQTEMAIFPNLETMDVHRMDNLEYIWHGQFADDDSLCKLKSLRIDSCSKLKAIFATSKNAMRKFQRLEELELEGCSKMEVIYQMEELGSIDEVALELRHLKIHYMPSLKQIWSEDANGVFTFPNLKSVEVSSCDVLEYVFPAFIAFELTHLKINYMKSLKRIWSEDANRVFSFPHLKSVQVIGCDVLEYVFPESIASGLLQLQKLQVAKCCQMEHVVGNQRLPWLPKVSFPNLTSLEVEECKSLKYIFKTSTVKILLQLKSLKIKDCELMEEIILTEGFEVEERNDKIVFSKLGFLELRWLPNLIRFSNGYFIESQSLRGMKITNCPTLRNFVTNISNNNSSNDVRALFNEMVSFPNLTSLEVEDCNSLKYIFKTSTVKSFLQLKCLNIKDCKLMEEIILTEKFEAKKRTDKIVFSKLDFLQLRKLPNLITFSNGYFIESRSLREMIIRDCPTLRNFVTDISNNNSSNDVRSLFNEMAIFPNLQAMDVSFMDNLEYIWHGQFADDDFLCKLKSLTINRCSKLKAVFATSKNVMRRFQKLEELEVLDCSKMEVIYQMEELGSIDEVAFDLIYLKIQYMPSLKWIWSEDANGVFTFPNLKSVEVSSCDVLEYVFPTFMAFELTHLKINYMKSLKRIWSEDANRDITFPNLKSVQVSRCHVLEYVFPESIASGVLQMEELKVDRCKMEYVVSNTKSGEPYNFKWPKLKHVQLIKNSHKYQRLPQLAKVCPNLEILELQGINTRKKQDEVYGDLDQELFLLEDGDLDEELFLLEDGDLDEELFLLEDDPQIAFIFQNLKRFEVCEYGRLKILMPFSACFKNLTYLEVSKCDEMINLITVSTAKSLVLLRTMIIRLCRMMQEIVRVESDGSEDVIGFDQLECLELDDLPSLTCFCSSNYAFDLPNLNDVKIIECPNMKTFSQRVLTPNLSGVETSNYYYSLEGSLNNTIQELFMDGRDEKAINEEIKLNVDDDEVDSEETDDDDDDEAYPEEIDDDDDDDDEADPEETDDDDEADPKETDDNDDDEADPEETEAEGKNEEKI